MHVNRHSKVPSSWLPASNVAAQTDPLEHSAELEQAESGAPVDPAPEELPQPSVSVPVPVSVSHIDHGGIVSFIGPPTDEPARSVSEAEHPPAATASSSVRVHRE
jgi:hypothetical protein